MRRIAVRRRELDAREERGPGRHRNSGTRKKASLTSVFEMIAGSSRLPQALAADRRSADPPSAFTMFSWHGSEGATAAEQVFAAQSGAHSGAVNIATRVIMATTMLRGPRPRVGLRSLILLHLLYAALFHPSTRTSLPVPLAKLLLSLHRPNADARANPPSHPLSRKTSGTQT